jgi:tetratricopeptide (TPR) repeat protein
MTSIWTVPFARNPYFTGREAILSQLHSVLHSRDVTALTQPHAVSGLGGIGKTQTAVEYAYRYRSEYHSVFWIHAETPDTALSDLAALATLLKLPEKDEPDAGRRVAAVKRWLAAHPGWLLILDNIEDVAMLTELVPSLAQGSVLLTTRSQVLVPGAYRIDLDEMIPEEGAVFLLRRAGLVAPDIAYGAIPSSLRLEAKAIAEVLDGLPLALDQTGAYIEETGCSLSDYLDRYRTSRAALLRRRGGLPASDHPESVAATWSLSFERLRKQNPTAADLLATCAFLAPDAIPEEIIREGASELGPHLGQAAVDPVELDEAIRDLRRFSLVRRDSATQTLSIHRLVQAVLRDTMDEQEQRLWAERVVRAVSCVYPASGEDVAQWQTCERLMSQVRACAALCDAFALADPEAARLFNQAGLYALDHAQYRIAEEWLQKALGIRSLLRSQHHSGVSDIDIAETMNDLGIVYSKQKEYVKAEALMRQALALFEQTFGSYHADVAVVTTNVALQLLYQEKYVEAEPLFVQALSIWQHHADPEEFAHIACTTNNLATLYVVQGQLAHAEQYFRQALALWEHVKGPEHPDVARTLSNLGRLYRDQGRYAEAEPLFLRARAIRDKMLGPDHPDTAQTLHDLAVLYLKQDRFTEAEPLFQLALEISQLALGNDHPLVVGTLTDYALLLRNNGRVAEANRMMQQVSSIQPDSVSER